MRDNTLRPLMELRPVLVDVLKNMLMSEGTHVHCTRPPKYLNMVLRDRAYGGPEEGGWWYGTQEPVVTLTLPTDTLAQRRLIPVMYKAMKEAVEAMNKERRPISSILSEGEYDFWLGNRPAKREPEETPYYS